MKYVDLAFVVVCVVTVVQMVGKRLPVPTPLLLVACGALLARVAHLDSLQDQAPLIFVLLVPPLLYIEAWLAPKRELWNALVPILGLAVGLVAATILIIALGSLALLPGLTLAAAFAMAAALAPTDTVAVASLVKLSPLPPRLKTVLSGEGLFNDVLALVTFEFAVAGVAARHAALGGIATKFLLIVAGGAAVGAAVAAFEYALHKLLMSDDEDHPAADVLLSLMAPYAAYLASLKLDVSGVLAVVVAGLVGGMLAPRRLSPRLRDQGKAVWLTVELTLNGAAFVLLGLEARQVLARLPGVSGWQLLAGSLLLTTVLVVIRAAWLIAAIVVFRMRLGSDPSGHPAAGTGRHLIVASFCGVRGTLTMTSVLSIPLMTLQGVAFPARDLIVALTAGTILTTLVVHGIVCVCLRRVRGPVPLEPPSVHSAEFRRPVVETPTTAGSRSLTTTSADTNLPATTLPATTLPATR